MNRQLQLWAPIQFVWLITRIVRVHAALGSQGVGFTLVAFVVGVTLGQWLKRHPTPLSTPGFVGVNRSGFLALIACVNTLTPAALISDTYDQAGMLLCIIAAVTYFTVILPGPHAAGNANSTKSRGASRPASRNPSWTARLREHWACTG